MNRRLSLQLSLSGAFIGVVILSCTVLGWNTFRSVQLFLRQGIRERMVDTVSIGALLIDVEQHAKIQKPEDENSEAYQTIVKRLREIRSRSTGIRFVYTLRRLPNGQVRFVVDGEEDPANKSAIGEVYETKTSTMLAAFEQPYRPLAEEAFYTDKWGTFLSSYTPLVGKDGKLEAVLGMDITADAVLAYERHYLILVAGAALAVCLGGMALGFILSGMLSRPLLQLTEDLTRIRNLELEHHAPIRSSITEVIQMSEAVESLKSGLRSFRKYVPADLVSELIKLGKEAVLGAEKKQLTIMFSDIADFTTISERLPPEMLSARLSDYLRGVTKKILERRGTVDKFIGDAVMAFWGAPSPSPDQAKQACLTALECQRFIATLDWPTGPKVPFLTRIGIHTGEAIVGNMGYEERLSYTAIGDNVNFSSRLEALNKYYGTLILISESTQEIVKDEMLSRKIDIVVVKGKTHGIAVFELIAERAQATPAQLELVAVYERGLEHYLARRFAEAITEFEATLALNPGDHASTLLIERCRGYLAEPPATDWNGVVHMRSK